MCLITTHLWSHVKSIRGERRSILPSLMESFTQLTFDLIFIDLAVTQKPACLSVWLHVLTLTKIKANSLFRMQPTMMGNHYYCYMRSLSISGLQVMQAKSRAPILQIKCNRQWDSQHRHFQLILITWDTWKCDLNTGHEKPLIPGLRFHSAPVCSELQSRTVRPSGRNNTFLEIIFVCLSNES